MMTFEEVYQQIRKMHYEILDILTEYRDEWCDDCKRFNTVIRETLNREPSEIIREEPTVPQKEYTEQQIRDTFNSGYSCGMQNEWITDEPPVDGQEVIATVYWTDYGDTITAYGHYNARFDTWSLYSDVEGGLNKGFEVIAWMPLPEPYKGGEDE